MTPAPHAHAAAASSLRTPPPISMLYTLLRHSHGLSHEEASRRIEQTLERIHGQDD